MNVKQHSLDSLNENQLCTYIYTDSMQNKVILKVNQLYVYHNVLKFRPKEKISPKYMANFRHGEPVNKVALLVCINHVCFGTEFGSFLQINRILWLFVAAAI